MPPTSRAELTLNPGGLLSLRLVFYEDLERGVPPARAITTLCEGIAERVRGSTWGIVYVGAGEPPRVVAGGLGQIELRSVIDGLTPASIAIREVRWSAVGHPSAGAARVLHEPSQALPVGHLLTWGIAPSVLPGMVLVAFVQAHSGDPLAAELAIELLGPPVEVALRLHAHGAPELPARTAPPSVRNAERLDGLAALAGGVAHEFNNQLTSILANVTLAHGHTAAGSPASSLLEAAERSIERASTIAQQMLAFSGRGRFAVRPESVNDAIEAIVPRLRLGIPGGHSLRLGLATGLPPVELDIAQFQQAVIHLVQNATEAIGDRPGSVWVRTLREEVADGEIQCPSFSGTLPAGTYIRVEVADPGPGFPPEVESRMFDPFFSTKGPGRGLGLSAVLGIARGHNGGVSAQCQAGRGSRFDLYLPALRTLPDERITLPRPILSGRVLLVDDDPLVRTTATAMLRQLQLSVTEAADGVEALAIFQADPTSFQLVILDLVMPRMDGPQTWRALRALDPAVPIILCSGYNNRDSPNPIPGEDLAGFLMKPFDRSDLARVITAALKQRPGR